MKAESISPSPVGGGKGRGLTCEGLIDGAPLPTSPLQGEEYGFTLLEVLVAVVILAVMGTALLRATAGSISSFSAAEEATLRAIIASNYLVELEQSKIWPSTERLSKPVFMSGRQWRATAEIKPTSSPSFKRVEVHVERMEAEEALQAPVMVGFLGKD